MDLAAGAKDGDGCDARRNGLEKQGRGTTYTGSVAVWVEEDAERQGRFRVGFAALSDAVETSTLLEYMGAELVDGRPGGGGLTFRVGSAIGSQMDLLRLVDQVVKASEVGSGF